MKIDEFFTDMGIGDLSAMVARMNRNIQEMEQDMRNPQEDMLSPIDWSRHRICDKCRGRYDPANPASELICIDNITKRTQKFVCINCMKDYPGILPSEVLRLIGLRTTHARSMAKVK